MTAFRTLLFFTALLAFGQMVVWDSVRNPDLQSATALVDDQQLQDLLLSGSDNPDNDTGIVPVSFALAQVPAEAQLQVLAETSLSRQIPVGSIRGPPLV
ncbi:MAG TPA: hypothetical protein DEA26_00055 [Oceanospirillales bacterium]|nr:hypothetical protein [Oceanospirillaceae bacterium]HBS41038.1 hypothetical protein [Oceanospirillales bacterium]|tara:strand:- start:744 stop:1040 length:297 start_codon:yes stop_codon:yes gene_type:complete